MKPHMTKKARKFFYQCLDKIDQDDYFEYGSGGSTYQACLRPNIRQIYCIESDPEWVKKISSEHLIQSNLASKRLNIKLVNWDTIPNRWGWPGPKSTPDQWQDYYLSFSKIPEPEKVKLILVDGRFRVACVLHLFDIISSNTLIFFDDFYDRSYYHIVLDYFELVKKVDRVALLKKNTKANSPSQDILQKYNQICY